MQDAAFDVPVEKLWQRPGDVVRISRRGELVRDCFDTLVFLCLLDHCVDKTGTIRAKNPGNAHHEIPILRSQHIFFSGQLRFPINTDWRRFIFLGVRLAFFPVENIIGAEMN